MPADPLTAYRLLAVDINILSNLARFLHQAGYDIRAKELEDLIERAKANPYREGGLD